MRKLNNVAPLTMDNVYLGRAELVEVYTTADGEEREAHFGIVNTAEREMEVETTEIFSSNAPSRQKVGELTSQIGLKFNFTTQSITRSARALSALSLEEVHALPADANFEVLATNIAVGERIPLGRAVNAITVDDGSAEPVEYVAGVDFEVVANGQAIVIKSKPAGASTDLVIKGSAPALTDGVKLRMGTAPQRTIHLRLYGLEAGKENMVMELKGTIKPDGAIGEIGENDPMEASYVVTAVPELDGSLGTITLG